ncbi:RidA family protein [Novosphingobium sp. KACC 22771]|uniref:RidA family protein n=1 Tax=Novosphingobium sp. KACC 22771 TaxID=3025670 RepID=UPI002366B485|nr:RidA family protein [Novosphingobium sp. KACC 22771]WDF71780.1 RidA family protein [Novosphingobium sp. KACC 22771]
MNEALTPILTDQAPAPAGHYAQAIRAGDMLYVSGQLPIRADKAPLEDMSFAAQARQAIANMLAIVEAAGGNPADLCRVTAYIVGVENWPEFNRVYAEMLGEARPARTVVPVPELHYGYLVEIDAVATLRV